MSKIRGELRQLSPARRLLGLLPVLVVALAVVAALGGVGVAGADEPEAVTLTATASDGTMVTVEADGGAIPAGTTLEATPVSNAAITEAVTNAAKADGTELATVKAYDVTLRSADGSEVEPSSAVKVTFSQTGMESDDVSVYHVTGADGNEANASSADELTVNAVDTQKAEADEQVFETDHFSVYAIGEQTKLLKVRFHQWNGSDAYSDTTVDYKIKKGDDLTKSVPDPGAGTLGNNQVFRGWIAANADGSAPTYTRDTALSTIEDVRTELERKLPPAKDGDTVDYYPVVFNAYTVTYLDQEGKVTLAQDTVLGVPGSTVSYTVQEISYDPVSQNQRFDGWVDDSGNTYQSGNVIDPLTSNVILKASVSNGYWITYNSGEGATHVAPAFYTSGNAPETLPVPTRAGCTFGGWYKDADCTDGNEYAAGTALTENTTLYAKWELVTEANYTIVYWQQNTSGNGYDYKESETLSGIPGYTVDTSAATKDRYPGFSLKSIEPANATINEDGSTVVNVYYDRNEYTLTFLTGDAQTWHSVSVYADGVSYSTFYGGPVYRSGWNQHQLEKNSSGEWGYYTGFGSRTWHPVTVYVDDVTENSDGTLSYNGQVLQRNGSQWGYYTNNPGATTTITALYGQPIYDRFTKSPLKDYDWTLNSDGSDPWLAFLQTMPAENRTYYSHSNSGSRVYRMNYYMENLPGSSGVSYRYNGTTKYFTKKLNPSWNSDGLQSTKDEDFVDFEGFEQWTSNPEFGSDNTADFTYDYSTHEYKIDFYYARKQYDVVYQDGKFVDASGKDQAESSQGILHTESGVYYEQSLSGYDEKYTPTHAGYVFEGWYTDPTCTTLANESVFSADSTMPAHSVTVYAKWVKVQYAVEFHPNGGTLPKADKNLVINNGETVQEPENFGQTRPGYELVGWYTDETCKKPFNFESVVSADTAEALNMEIPYSDADHPYVQGKLNLYAKWRRTIAAEGVTVVYDAAAGTINNGSTYTDPALYQTDSDVIGTGAATPADKTKNFQYWVLQTWDAATGAFVDTNTHVYPGSSFNLASVTAHEFKDADGKDQAVVQLRAEYGDKLPMTKVVFNANGGKYDDNSTTWSKDYNINDDVYLPGDTATDVTIPAEPERDGYEFVGWATKAPAADATDEQVEAAVQIQPKASRTQTYRADNLAGIAKEQLEGTTNTLYACWKPKFVTLVIRKEIAGKQADLTKGYKFTVTGTDGSIRDYTADTKELFDHSGEQGSGDTDEVKSLSKGTATLKLKRGDKVTISESNHAGYDTSYEVTGGTKNVDGSITLDGVKGTDGTYTTTVVWTNTKTNTVITGIKSAGVPGAVTAVGAAALAIAGGFAYVRRREAEAGAHARRRGRR